MPDAKRPDPRRRTAASRPGSGAKGRPGGASPIHRQPRAIEPRPAQPDSDPQDPSVTDDDGEDTAVIRTIKTAITDAADAQSEQRFGSAARRAAILAAVICVLTLTIAGPVRTYFAQRAEMQQLAAAEAQLRAQIADLEQQKEKLADPVFIAAQARERLGFVMPGDIPYQVQLPVAVGPVEDPKSGPAVAPSGQPWYTALWHTIADVPQAVSPVPPVPPGPGAPLPPPAPPGG